MKPSRSRGTVLVVEDDDAVRRGLVRLLEVAGYPSLAAANGREALDLLRSAPTAPKVILLDLRMPVMNGWEFYTAKQRETALAAIPVIFISSDAELSRYLPAGAPGVAAVLGKPFEPGRVLSLVRRYCVDHPKESP